MKKNSSKHTVLIYIIAGLLAVAGLLVLHGYFYITVIRRPSETKSEKIKYDRHYAMIPENTDSMVWEDIYRAAQDTAREHNVYLEWFGNWSPEQYSMLDYIEMAIASNVDGIIVRADGTVKMTEAINKANEAGIPVITILNDDTKSERRSYVGPNSYQMGSVYGNAVAKALTENTKKIMVVQRRDLGGKELILKKLKEELQRELSAEEYAKLSIESMQIISRNAFDVEEIIRDILNDDTQRPDLLVCMNEYDSESAYHAMIDYNLVGEMDMIGYYNTATMVSSIRKGIISSAVTIDTAQVGKYCIEALEEYYNMGYVSDYFSVNLNLIEKNNSVEYLAAVNTMNGVKNGSNKK